MAIYPIRPVAEDELAGFLAVDQHASHGTPLSERAHANLLARLEFDRTLVALDGDTIIGTAGVFSFQMRVPGAMAAVAGVSLVAVLPSHRGQGVLSALMRRQLADLSERGEAVAVLFCSESGIYGRYGYGRASWYAAYRLQRGEGAPAPGAPQNDPSLIAIKGQPTKALDDAVYDAAMLLQDRDSRKRRKIILLISDGRNGAKFNTRKYDEVRSELLRQGIAVYSVATGSAYFDRKFDRLVSYAHDTVGDVYFGVKQGTFSEFYSRITEEARNQYTLVYSPRGESKEDYHTIEVRVRREGLTVLAREGYYGGTFATVPQK